MELSQKNLKEAKKQLLDIRKAYEKGIGNAIEKATVELYNFVIAYCQEYGIENDIKDIQYKYDETTNAGRVWTHNWVIIFNEMGTGITGKQNPHPNPSEPFKSWKYDVNEHGEKGWYYPKGDGTYGWTKGLPSRHMFNSAFEDMKQEFGDIVSVEIRKTVGDLYVNK